MVNFLYRKTISQMASYKVNRWSKSHNSFKSKKKYCERQPMEGMNPLSIKAYYDTDSGVTFIRCHCVTTVKQISHSPNAYSQI